MNKESFDFRSAFLANLHPAKQLLFVLGCAMIAYLIVFSSGWESETHWLVACSGILFFAICNPIISVFQVRWLKYIAWSIPIFLLLCGVLMQFAKFFSGISIMDLRAYQMIIGASTVFFIISLVLARLIRAIFQFTGDY